jgi:cobalt-zinc-cadmium efflux system protein
MAHNHEHHHDHSVLPANINTAFVIGIALNFLFVVVQVVAGLMVHSLSLLSDAGHNFADVGALAISLLAFRLLKVKSNKQYTYGYRKTSVLTALFNAMVLLVSIGAILYEAAHRFFNPEPMSGVTIAVVSGIGIFVNGISGLLFLRDKEKDLNIKSAYLHLMSDALISLGLVIGGIIIHFTGWYWVDSLLSIIVAVIILISTWRLLKNTVRLSLDGVPHDIDFDDIKATALSVPGVKGFHHIHIWAISTAENALTAHLVLPHGITSDEEQRIKNNVKHELEHKNIRHVTLETEKEDEDCNGVCG